MHNEDLNGFAEAIWQFGIEQLQTTGELSPQIAVALENGEITPVGMLTDMPPHTVLNLVLRAERCSAFVVLAEAWVGIAPKGIVDEAAARAWRKPLPKSLGDLPSAMRGECLMLTAVGTDYSLQRLMDFRRVNGRIEFGEERGRPDQSYNRFFDLRELLVQPREKTEEAS